MQLNYLQEVIAYPANEAAQRTVCKTSAVGLLFHLTTWAISSEILLPKIIRGVEVTGSRSSVVLQGPMSINYQQKELMSPYSE